MKINSYKIIATGISIAAFAICAVPAFAQTTTSSTATNQGWRQGNRGGMMGSSTRPRMSSTTRAQMMQQRITDGQNKGGAEADKRIQSLETLITRIQGLKNVSDADKTSIENDLKTEISNLNSIKTRIGSDDSTTTLRSDMGSLIGGNRVYDLLIPKTNILAAADRVNTLVTMMNTIGTKLQSRLSSTTNTTNIAAAQSALTDFNAKVSDAGVQAKAASDEVTALVPDNGDKTKLASNTATLKDARTKIQAAQQDLVAARKDVEIIKNSLKGIVTPVESMTATSTTK